MVEGYEELMRPKDVAKIFNIIDENALRAAKEEDYQSC